MITKDINKNRGIGDCRLAVGHITGRLWFESMAEVNHLIRELSKHVNFSVKPKVKYSKRRTTRLAARVSTVTGTITVFAMGFNVCTIIHELAHLEGTGHHNHGRDFKQAQTKLLRCYDKHIHNADKASPRVDKAGKVCDTTIKQVEERYKTKSGFWTTRTIYTEEASW